MYKWRGTTRAGVMTGIAGALAHLGYEVSDQTVGNVLWRHRIAPAPKRSQTTAWKDFISSHMAIMSGMDFFTAEVLTWRGLATYYVLFVIQLETRKVTLAGITRHPTEQWMEQIARNLTDAEGGALRGQRYPELHGGLRRTRPSKPHYAPAGDPRSWRARGLPRTPGAC